MEDIFNQVISFTGNFNIQLVIALYLICAIGEFGASVPYLLEGVWILAGYHVATGTFNPLHLASLWVVAQLGRQTGALALYYLSRVGSSRLIKFYKRRFEGSTSTGEPRGIFRRARQVNYLSPFSVALGRLFWLRIPLTLTLGALRRWRVLAAGVVISSLVWDNIYIIIGAIGGKAVLKPYELVIYSLVGLTVIYLASLVGKLLNRWRATRGNA